MISSLSTFWGKASGVFMVLFCLLVSLNPLLKAQGSFVDENDIFFKRYGVEEGLSHATVHHVMQDKDGFMWISTRDGVSRFDGYRFEVFKYDPSDKNSLAANTVWMTTQTADGLIWMATLGGGISIYDPEEGTFENYSHIPDEPKSLSSNTVTTIYQAKDGSVWVGTEGGGLNRVIREEDPADYTFKSYRQEPDHPESISSDIVMDIEEDHEGNLWVATYGGGLNRFDPETETFRSGFGIEGRFVMSLAIDGSRIWAGTKYNGLSLMDMESHTSRTFRHRPGDANSIGFDFIWPVYRDREGNIWVGTFGGGLNRVKEKKSDGEAEFTFVRYHYSREDPYSLPANLVLSIYEDRNGLMWTGTENGGFATFSKSQLFKKPDISIDGNLDIDELKVNDILKGSDNKQWLATSEGVLALQPNGRGELLGADEELVVNTICEDQHQRLFMGTNQGLYQFHRDRAVLVKIPVSDASGTVTVDRVFDMKEDGRGRFWISTNTGLWRLGPDLNLQKRYYHESGNPNSLSTTHTGKLLFEGDTLWVATSSSGLNKVVLSTGKVTRFQSEAGNPGSLSNNKVYDLLRDKKGQLWIATYGGGLNRMVPNGEEPYFEHFFERDGLPSNTVKSIASDSRGRLWVSTQEGLARVEEEGRNIFPVHIPVGYSNRNLNEIISAGDSLFILTGSRGFRYFSSESFNNLNNDAPVVLSEIRVMNERYAPKDSGTPGGGLSLAHDKNFISFEFALLDYYAPERNRYQYRLEGLEAEWVDAENRRYASYTDLAPGTYTFRVRAKNYGGFESVKSLSLPLTIHPPYWASWWFRLLAFFAVSGLLYMAYRYRIHSLMKVEHTRRRIANDLHDEISATLSSISYFARAVKEDTNGREERFISLIAESANEAKEKITDIIWSINPENHGWTDLLSKCRRHASDVFESKNIKYDLQIDSTIDEPLSLEMRQNLWMIFKEMVTNAARHSEADFVHIRFQFTNGRLQLVFRDNGCGFDPEKCTGREGLRNIKARCGEMNGSLELETAPGQGTSWSMEVKL